MNKLLQDQKGMTLVEVLVATVLLSMVILTALSLLSNGIGVSDINNERTLALNLAEERMEYWKYSLPTSWKSDSVIQSEMPYNREHRTFYAEVTAREYIPDSSTELGADIVFAEITVKVWTKDSSNPEVELKTVVNANSGM